MSKQTTRICYFGRCSTWGKSWKKHLYTYDSPEQCIRCGMDRREQWEEDKALKLVTGEYKVPQLSKPKPKQSTSQQIMYCAVGDYGIEAEFPTEKQCRRWIDEQKEEHEFDTEYYEIATYTKAQLAAMPEV